MKIAGKLIRNSSITENTPDSFRAIYKGFEINVHLVRPNEYDVYVLAANGSIAANLTAYRFNMRDAIIVAIQRANI